MTICIGDGLTAAPRSCRDDVGLDAAEVATSPFARCKAICTRDCFLPDDNLTVPSFAAECIDDALAPLRVARGAICLDA